MKDIEESEKEEFENDPVLYYDYIKLLDVKVVEK